MAKTAQEYVHAGNVAMQAKKYAAGAKAFGEAMKKDRDHEYAVYGKIYCLNELADKAKGAEKKKVQKEIVKLADTLDELIPDYSLKGLKKNDPAYEMLRTAQSSYAKAKMDIDQTPQGLIIALASIDGCLMQLMTKFVSDNAKAYYLSIKINVLNRIIEKEFAEPKEQEMYIKEKAATEKLIAKLKK